MVDMGWCADQTFASLAWLRTKLRPIRQTDAGIGIGIVYGRGKGERAERLRHLQTCKRHLVRFRIQDVGVCVRVAKVTTLLCDAYAAYCERHV